MNKKQKKMILNIGLISWNELIRAHARQSVRSSRSETTDFTFDEDARTDGEQQHTTLIRRDVTFSE